MFDEADPAFAAASQTTLTPDDIATSGARFGIVFNPHQPPCDQILPLGAGDGTLVASTAVGMVSRVVAIVQMRDAIQAIGTPRGHSGAVIAMLGA